jgi:hypothetical protein
VHISNLRSQVSAVASDVRILSGEQRELGKVGGATLPHGRLRASRVSLVHASSLHCICTGVTEGVRESARARLCLCASPDWGVCRVCVCLLTWDHLSGTARRRRRLAQRVES